MSRILKVSQSDYRVKVKDNGTITLDTGELIGTVYVTGNLTVQGTMTTIESVNTTIVDNILVLNNGETSNTGISLTTAGIQIDRGPTVDTAQILFDEDLTHYDPVTNTDLQGSYVLRMVNQDDDTTTLGGLHLNSIAFAGSDFVFDFQGSNTNLLRLANISAATYSSYLSAHVGEIYDNSLTTKRYISDYIASGQVTPGMADVDKIYKADQYGTTRTEAIAELSTIDFKVYSSSLLRLKMRVSASGVDINEINIYGGTITNTVNPNPLILTATSKLVEVDATLAIQEQATAPAPLSGKTKIFPMATIGPGRTGIYFNNLTLQDELVAKNRALLLSMLF